MAQKQNKRQSIVGGWKIAQNVQIDVTVNVSPTYFQNKSGFSIHKLHATTYIYGSYLMNHSLVESAR